MRLEKEIQWPFYAKASIILVGLIALVAILYIAQDIIVPIVFAIVFAIVLHPIVSFFVRLKVNRVIAIVLAIIIATAGIVGLIALLFTQATRFTETWPILVDKFTDTLNQIITSVSGFLGIDPQKIHEWLTKSIHELIDTSNAAIGNTLLTLGASLLIIFLLPLYIFLILYYQPLIMEFIRRLFVNSDQGQVNKIVKQTKTVIQLYLTGLIIEAVMVAFLNTTVLFTLGIDYAILLGIIGALLNVIPYIGGLVAVALPMMVALATKSTAWYPIYVLIGYYIVQLIDNNFIVPYIVASKVKINALFSIIIVLAGNALWGVSGMFLSIPLLAIVKLFFDNIESLKPWGFLLGDAMPTLIKVNPIRLRRTSKEVTQSGKPDNDIL